MRQKAWKCCALLLATAMTLAGCGGGTGSPSTGTSGSESQGGQIEVNKDAIWKSEPLNLGAEIKTEELYGGMAFANGMLYLCGEEMLKEGEIQRAQPYVVRCKPDGREAEKLVLDSPPQGTIYSYYSVGDDGAIYAIKTVYPEGMYEEMNAEDPGTGGTMDANEPMTEVAEGEVVFDEAPEGSTETADTADTGDTAQEAETGGEDAAPDAETGMEDAASDGLESYYIVKFDASGEKVFETKIEPDAKSSEAGWFTVNGMKYSHGKLVISDNAGVSLFSTEDGSRLKTVLENDSYPTICVSKDGDVYVSYWNEEGQVLTRIDAEAGKAGDQTTVPTAMMLYNTTDMIPGAESDFLVTDTTGVNSWNLSDEKPVQILSLIDSDLNIDSFEALVQVSPTEMVGMYQSADEGRVFGRFIKQDPAGIKDRETLTLACQYLDHNLRNAIVHFNQTNTDYRITVHDYSKYFTGNNWDEGYNKLNNDIISGNAPDIMAMDSGRYTRIYQSKGLLEPLESYMENDPEISKNEYVDKVFDVYRYQGELCLLTPSFTMCTYAVKASDAEQITEWSLETLQKMTEERGIEYSDLFGEWPMSCDSMLSTSLVFDNKNYFDWDAHRVRFDSKDFIDLLNFSKKFPAEIDYNSATNQDRSALFRSGKALVAQAFFGSFNDFKRLKYGTFGEDITFVGFPREAGTGGSSVMASTQFAMSSESKNKDACWQFLRSFLLDDYQQSIIDDMGYMFPVSKKHLEQMAKKAMERETYTDDEGETQYINESVYINGAEVKLPTLTQEDVDQVMELFETADSAYELDETLMNIVQEETAPFFKGQKTAEECAKILQSKAQIYIDENS